MAIMLRPKLSSEYCFTSENLIRWTTRKNCLATLKNDSENGSQKDPINYRKISRFRISNEPTLKMGTVRSIKMSRNPR